MNYRNIAIGLVTSSILGFSLLQNLNSLDTIRLSREYGICESNIRGWVKKYSSITTSTGEVTNNDEILKLKKELKEKEIEIEILKKAVAIFSKK